MKYYRSIIIGMFTIMVGLVGLFLANPFSKHIRISKSDAESIIAKILPDMHYDSFEYVYTTAGMGSRPFIFFKISVPNSEFMEWKKVVNIASILDRNDLVSGYERVFIDMEQYEKYYDLHINKGDLLFKNIECAGIIIKKNNIYYIYTNVIY